MIYLIALLFWMISMISLVMMYFSYDHDFAWLVSALVSISIWFFIGELLI